MDDHQVDNIDETRRIPLNLPLMSTNSPLSIVVHKVPRYDPKRFFFAAIAQSDEDVGRGAGETIR